MLGTVQTLYADDGDKVGGDAGDVRTHRVEQVAQLLDVRLAGSIIYCGGALGEDRRHDDVGGSRNRSLIKEHIRALQMLSLNGEHLALVVADELRPKILESEEVGVQSSATNLVATRLCHRSLAEASEQRTHKQHAASES